LARYETSRRREAKSGSVKPGLTDLAMPLTIEKLGERGEGMARAPHGLVFVPYALPGEDILAEVDGERGRLGEILKASPERISPECRYFGLCGGCAMQMLSPAPYAAWKRGLVVEALRQAKVDADVAPLLAAHGEGRRRATFHARLSPRRDRMIVGFMQARAHALIEIEACPVLAPSMTGALAAAQALADALIAFEKPLDIVVTATNAGLDIDLRGTGLLDEKTRQTLIAITQERDLARVSNHGIIVIERKPPLLTMGEAEVVPPPGTFLQATAAGEAALASFVTKALDGRKHIADLFSGLGTFALRLAEKAEVQAYDFEEEALNALRKASNASQSVRAVAVERRDLFRRPLSAQELKPFDGLVFDPPRSGAEQQAATIAQSQVPIVVAVSCNARSFARDAKILIDGGYKLEEVQPVDQFLYSPHVEIAARFQRDGAKTQRRKKLLG